MWVRSFANARRTSAHHFFVLAEVRLRAQAWQYKPKCQIRTNTSSETKIRTQHFAPIREGSKAMYHELVRKEGRSALTQPSYIICTTEMGRKSNLTESEINTIDLLRNERFSYRAIGARVKSSTSAVAEVCTKHTTNPKRDKRGTGRKNSPKTSRTLVRNGRKGYHTSRMLRY